MNIVLTALVQVDKAKILRLAKKAPVLLRRPPARVADVCAYLQEVSGNGPQAVHQMFMAWPVLATHNKEMLVARCAALTLLPGALLTQHQTQHICNIQHSKL